MLRRMKFVLGKVESAKGGLKDLYKYKLLPLEKCYNFHDFHSPALDDPDFDAKPMVLLIGQYSTGKTTFIRYILGEDFPGMHVGPEPTTDRFISLQFGKRGVIPGNALVEDPSKQYRQLSRFGMQFLNRFQCSTLPSSVLETISIVDTPGILSGDKQRIDRGYDFTGVMKWFAERVDRIILLFDAHKLDISDEFKSSIAALNGNDDKIRIILNKADRVPHQQLMRVYGALMWSLGKILPKPECARVYIGSFWDQPFEHVTNKKLFEDEERDLIEDMHSLPRDATLRKLNDFIKRAKLAKVHAYLISELRKEMPSFFGKDGKKSDLIENLDVIYERLKIIHNIPYGDLPNYKIMQHSLRDKDFTKFPRLKLGLIKNVDAMLAHDVPKLMSLLQIENQESNGDAVKGGAFDDIINENKTPFSEDAHLIFGEKDWICNEIREETNIIFEGLSPIDGKISGRVAKKAFMKSKLPNHVLGKIWKLSDVDSDGFLDAEEFALAKYLISIKSDGGDLPTELPEYLTPPSKRVSKT